MFTQLCRIKDVQTLTGAYSADGKQLEVPGPGSQTLIMLIPSLWGVIIHWLTHRTRVNVQSSKAYHDYIGVPSLPVGLGR
jgi:hypothetical protein